MNDFSEWEHGFEFPVDDERAQNNSLETLRVSCLHCYLREQRLQEMVELDKRISLVENNATIWKAATILVPEQAANMIAEKPVVFVVCVAIVVGLSFSLPSVPARVFSPSGFFRCLLLFGPIAICGWLLFALYKSIPDLRECKLQLESCRESYEKDKAAYAVYETEVEMYEDKLTELIDHGGVPEDYWSYGGEIWRIVYSGQADTRFDALRYLERELFSTDLDDIVSSVDID